VPVGPRLRFAPLQLEQIFEKWQGQHFGRHMSAYNEIGKVYDAMDREKWHGAL
jgi:hypothetical protein